MKVVVDDRPDPDELLEQARKGADQRGQLKIFFGASPGVGKTFAMLESAHRQKQEGVDVVVGYLESHGRKATQDKSDGLEILPRRVMSHRGLEVTEFDLAGAIERRPGLLLLDELAHTNVAGSLHAKRWQDAVDLLDSGIDVYTTLNVQHLESLNDVVRDVTGIRVRETVPDALLARASDIELCDLPPDELLERLDEGKIYRPEQAARARDNFFRRGNLLALRELALRATAQRVDADVLAYRREHSIHETWASGERILVCVGPAPASRGLVRAARRMADGLRAPLLAVAIESTRGAAPPASSVRRLDENLHLAESLGAEVVRLAGENVAHEILEFAKRRNVTRIVIGKPTHSRLRDFVRGSVLDEVVRGSGTIDVHVTKGSREDEAEGAAIAPAAPPSAQPIGWVPLGGAGLAVLLATLLGELVGTQVDLADIVMIYLAAIVAVAVRLTRGASILAAALSVAALDFFFVPPLYTFNVSDTKHVLTFVMMFVLGILISGLMTRIRRQGIRARLREERTRALYLLTKKLGGATTEKEIADTSASEIHDSFGEGATILLVHPKTRKLEAAASSGRPIGADQDASTLYPLAQWSALHRKEAGRGTDTLSGSSGYAAPILAGDQSVGAAVLEKGSQRTAEGAELGREQRELLDGMLRQVGLAVARVRLADEARASALKAKTEELRSVLLSAVSHDLRTPLAAITGSATTLLDPESSFSPSEREDLLTAICEEAERLERLVGNLLDMTRLESGGLEVRREWVPLEEIVGSALTRLEKKLGDRSVVTHLPEDLPLLSGDPVLLGQVFVNLLENVAKYTPAGTSIQITAEKTPEGIAVELLDEGPGLPEGLGSRLFDRFVRGPSVGKQGVGLGLAICKGIIEAHGGTIEAATRREGGARFRITLPIDGSAPSIPDEIPTSKREVSP